VNNSQFNKILSWIVLASFALWTYGCTTTVHTTDVRTCQSKEITVKTIDGCRYLLTTWNFDKSQNITGKGTQVLHSQGNGTEYKPFTGILMLTDIVAVEYSEVDWSNTTLLVVPFAVALSFIIYVIVTFNFHGTLG
jgi:hypothetical protein